MITRYDMIGPLIEALPEIRPHWEAFVATWIDEPYTERQDPRDLPNYLFLGDLAGMLAAMLQAGRADDVAKALAVCERWLLEGDKYVREAAAIGLIEDLQGYGHRLKIDEARFTALLGPEGRRWWDKVNAFWGKGKLLVDESG
jgi:hypothetical protein